MDSGAGNHADLFGWRRLLGTALDARQYDGIPDCGAHPIRCASCEDVGTALSNRHFPCNTAHTANFPLYPKPGYLGSLTRPRAIRFSWRTGV